MFFFCCRVFSFFKLPPNTLMHRFVSFKLPLECLMILLAEISDSEENSNRFIIMSFLTRLMLASVPSDINTMGLCGSRSII